jgi:thiol-disulfide isomerase/thioredoxin
MNVRLALALTCAAVVCGLAVAANGEEAKLKVGDPAPKLQVAKWVQGDPVKEFSKDHAYIVEFWATWCGPCRESIPHLNEIYKKFKDKGLVVIGQDVWEEDDSDVPKFVKQMGDKMTYRVALDDKKGSEKGKMAETWMEAARQGGIPTAFVITKTAEIAWIGHPMSLKEQLLEEVLAGNFDVKKAAAEYAQQKEREEKYEAAFKNFQLAAKDKNWEKAENYLQDMEKVMTDEDGRTEVEMVRLRMNLMKGDTATAETVAKRLSEKQPDNAAFHGAIAWQLATQENASKGLLDIAEKEANRANDLAKGKDADVLDTLARVQFARGEKEAAVATEEKAVEAAEEGKAKANYQKTLDSYKAGKLPTE